MNTNQQLDIFRMGQPDEEAVKLLRFYEPSALMRDPRGYCVCTSEGKDSRVLGHLMRRAGVKHFYLHNITGIDPPELVYFQRRNFLAYRDEGYPAYDVMYELSMWQLMKKKKIPPLRQKRYCCEFLKERHVAEQGEAMISTGVRKAESTRRAMMRSELELRGRRASDNAHLTPYDEDADREIFEGCMNNPRWSKGLLIINPIAEWPEHWIWDYSAEAHLEQCSLYNEGFTRLGCIGCPQAQRSGRIRDFKRWPAFERLWRRAFDELVKLREACGLPQRFSSGAEWFEWWLSDAAQEEPVDENQLVLEELQAYRAKIPYDRLDEVAALVKAQNDGPCGLCRYSKPSSCDGKPCTMCPAEAQREEGQDS